MSTTPDDVIRRGRAAVAEHRDRLAATFGWTHLEVELRPTASGGLRLDGVLALPRMVGALVRAVQCAVGPEVEVVPHLRGLASIGWVRSTAEVMTLMRGLEDAHPGRGVVTELERDEGPLQALARNETASLVRARDGTVGWTGVDLAQSEPQELPRPSRTASLEEELRSHLGVPYVLGGRTTGGIDCSGLVQRALWRATRLMLPRHSGDQLAIGPDEHPPAPGDLLFAWTEAEAPGHVGVVTQIDRSLSVIHASRSRGRVVADPVRLFVSQAQRVRRVSGEALWRFAESHAGCLALPESAIGNRRSAYPCRPPRHRP